MSSFHDQKQRSFTNSVRNAIEFYRFASNWLGNYCVKFHATRLKIHYNTTNSYFLLTFRSLSETINLHQKKKLVLVLPVLGTTRTWTWRAKKSVVCVTELIAAFVDCAPSLGMYMASLINLVRRSGSLSITVALDQLIVWFSCFAWSVRADLLISAKLAVRWLLANARLVFDSHSVLCSWSLTPGFL